LYEALSSRAIIGRYYMTLEGLSRGWVAPLVMDVNSDQQTETYNWLGMTPAMREAIDGRKAKGLRVSEYAITNKEYEATLEIATKDLRRDKTGQIMVRVDDLARRTATHVNSLMSAAIIAGETALCYDGEAFFDTDHSEGDSGQQSNDLSFDISADAAVPTAEQGSTTKPGVAVMEQAILNSVQTMLGFKDDQGEPLNEDATSFVVMVPIPFWRATIAALKVATTGSGRTNVLTAAAEGLNFTLVANPRLTWTTKFATFRTDAMTKPFFFQEEVPVQMSAIAEGSEEEFKNFRHLYGVYASRAVGYGFWQHACLTTLT